MRENAWHVRLPKTEHLQWFKNLVDLHDLTTSWLKETQTERPSHLLTRGLHSEIGSNLWMLESLSTTRLENLLDETPVENLLTRLEKTIWVVQAWTLNSLRDRAQEKTLHALDSLLEQLCWKLGRKTAEIRWKKALSKNTPTLNLQEVLLALNDSPFSGYPHSSGFLVRRSISQELFIEMRACPHRLTIPEVQAVADRLCQLHTDWIRGFVYALNNRIYVESQTCNPRCQQHWLYKTV